MTIWQYVQSSQLVTHLCKDAVHYKWWCSKTLWYYAITTIAKLPLTLIGSEFTVSGFDRSHKVSSDYHWCEADITVVFPHQGPECEPMDKKNT